MMREIDTTHHGKLTKAEFVAILMESYGEDALQQYDDRLYHDPDYSFSVSQELLLADRSLDGECSFGTVSIDNGYFF